MPKEKKKNMFVKRNTESIWKYWNWAPTEVGGPAMGSLGEGWGVSENCIFSRSFDFLAMLMCYIFKNKVKSQEREKTYNWIQTNFNDMSNREHNHKKETREKINPLILNKVFWLSTLSRCHPRTKNSKGILSCICWRWCYCYNDFDAMVNVS